MRPIDYVQLCSVAVWGATLLVRPLSAQEADANASARSAAAEYLATSGLDDVGRFALRINERVLVDVATKRDTGLIRDSVRTFAAGLVTWDSIRNDAIRLLTEQFTEQELRDMLAFRRSQGGFMYAATITNAARRYANVDLPEDTVRMLFARALDDIRPTKQELADSRRFVSTPLGQKFIRLPAEIMNLANQEFAARLGPQAWRLQLMAERVEPGKGRRVVDFSGRGVAAGARRDTAGQVYFEFKVDKQATQLPGHGTLRYPEQLRAANVEGEVLVQFVVDTNGLADTSTVKVIRSGHELFTAAVKEALPEMRFTPAEVGKRKVNQLVEQPFTFSLQRDSAATRAAPLRARPPRAPSRSRARPAPPA